VQNSEQDRSSRIDSRKKIEGDECLSHYLIMESRRAQKSMEVVFWK